MKIVFIVDDNETNLMAAKLALEGHYKSYALLSAARMFKLAEKIMPDLILLDVDMPGMNGFEAMSALKSDERLQSVPVVFLTARQDPESEIRGFEMGALDFINKPFSPPVLLKRIQAHIETDRLIKDSLKSVKNIYNATISVITDLVESRDKTTGRHIVQTQKYLKILLERLSADGIYNEEIAHWDISVLVSAAQLHDIGKVTIPDTILNKPGKLTDEEFEQFKTHAVEGEKAIDTISAQTDDTDSFLLHAKKFAGAHHEKWDGSGYPRGLKGAEIPLEGRILAVADVYDELVSPRPYKQPISHEEAVEIIKSASGTHFDPTIVETFLAAAEDFWLESV